MLIGALSRDRCVGGKQEAVPAWGMWPRALGRAGQGPGLTQPEMTLTLTCLSPKLSGRWWKHRRWCTR